MLMFLHAICKTLREWNSQWQTVVKLRCTFRCILHHLSNTPDAILHCRKSILHVLSPVPYSFATYSNLLGRLLQDCIKQPQKLLLASICCAKGCTSSIVKENTDIWAIEKKEWSWDRELYGVYMRMHNLLSAKDFPIPHREPEMGCPWKTGSEFSARRPKLNSLLLLSEVLWYPKKKNP